MQGHRLKPLALAAVAAVLALAAASATASANPTQNGWGHGIADDNLPSGQPYPLSYDIFGTQAWKRLRVKVHRFTAAWNAWYVPDEMDRLRRKVARASAYPVEVMVTFRKGWGDAAPPTPDQYARAIEPVVRELNSKVRYWGPANEPNYGQGWTGSDPRGQGPRLAAGYYGRLKSLLQLLGTPEKLVSPDFHDAYASKSHTEVRLKPSPYDPAKSIVRDWIDSYRAAGGGFGVKAAFHPYGGVHRRNVASTLDFLAAVPNDVFFTEVGSIISSSMGVYHTEAEQNAEVDFLVNTLATLSPRVKRVYYYHQRELNPDWGWDSGLQAPDGRLRDAWVTYCRTTHTLTDPVPDCVR